MSTLGGEEALAQARSGPTGPLELRYRPDDPLSHGLYGDLHRTPGNLLLRLTRPRQPPAAEQVFARGTSFASSSAVASPRQLERLCSVDADEGGSLTPAALQSADVGQASQGAGQGGQATTPPGDANDGEGELAGVSAEVVARVRQVYRFSGMADYQYTAAGHFDGCARLQEQKQENWKGFARGEQIKRAAEEGTRCLYHLPSLTSHRRQLADPSPHKSLSCFGPAASGSLTRRYIPNALPPCRAVRRRKTRRKSRRRAWWSHPSSPRLTCPTRTPSTPTSPIAPRRLPPPINPRWPRSGPCRASPPVRAPAHACRQPRVVFVVVFVSCRTDRPRHLHCTNTPTAHLLFRLARRGGRPPHLYHLGGAGAV